MEDSGDVRRCQECLLASGYVKIAIENGDL